MRLLLTFITLTILSACSVEKIGEMEGVTNEVIKTKQGVDIRITPIEEGK